MLKRETEEKLALWKNRENKKALLIKGARYTGKTYTVRKFGKENYQCFAELNAGKDQGIKTLLSAPSDTFISDIEKHTGISLIPFKTLIFIDEAQYCPNILRYVSQYNGFDFIAAASEDIQDEGCFECLDIYPLSFREYLSARGVPDDIVSLLRDCFERKERVDDFINDRILEYFREYTVIGGMPEAVYSFVRERNYGLVLDIQRKIIGDYKNDISRYGHLKDRIKTERCFESIPSQLSNKNKKFMYTRVEKGSSGRKYLSSVNRLTDSYTVNRSTCVREINDPLRAFENRDFFKLYMNDTGLLLSMLEEKTNARIIDGDISIYNNAVLENVISQTLVSNGHKLHYYTRNNSLEIDFVLSQNGRCVPLELVRKSNKSKSLSTLLKENPDMKGIKLHNGNVGVSNNLITLPLYMAMFL